MRRAWAVVLFTHLLVANFILIILKDQPVLSLRVLVPSIAVVATLSTLLFSPSLAPILRADGAAAAKSLDGIIESLERDFRIHTYYAFRLKRSEYDRRLAEWRAVAEAWRAAEPSDAARRQYIEWLEGATAASRRDSIRRLPERPGFGREQIARSTPTFQSPHESIDRRVVMPPVEAPRTTISAELHFKRSDDDREAPNRTFVDAAAGVSDLPAPRIASRVDLPREAKGRRLQPAKATKAPLFDEPARIDAEELAARVAGYNLALAALVETVEKHGPWSDRALAAAVDRLEALVVRHDDLAPYVNLVDPLDRGRIDDLQSPDGAIGAVARYVDQAINNEQTFAAESADASRIDSLRQTARRLESLRNRAND